MSVRLAWTPAPNRSEGVVGSLVRWREAPRARWTYAYFRGKQEGVMVFSDTSEGPITRWVIVLPGPVQFAEVVRDGIGSVVPQSQVVEAVEREL